MSSITLKCSTTVTAATAIWAASVPRPSNGPRREAKKCRKSLGSPGKVMPFVVYRRKVGSITMPTNRVVEHFDVVKDILACQLPGYIDLAFNAFALWQLEEAFGNGVVMTITSA